MHMSIRRQHSPILTALRSASAARLAQWQRAGSRSNLADHTHLRSNNHRMIHRRTLRLTTEHTASRRVSCGHFSSIPSMDRRSRHGGAVNGGAHGLHHLVTFRGDDVGQVEDARGLADPNCAAHWLLHFTVASKIGTDAAARRVLALGGRVDVDPYDTELGRIARVADPSGATFALIDPTDRVDAAAYLAAGPARVDDPYDD